MTYRDRLKEDTGQSNVLGRGCPCDHKYEERPKYSTHCKFTDCEDCWDRKIPRTAVVVDGTDESFDVSKLMKGGAIWVG